MKSGIADFAEDSPSPLDGVVAPQFGGAKEARCNPCFFPGCLFGNVGQHGVIADVAAFLEIRLEQ